MAEQEESMEVMKMKKSSFVTMILGTVAGVLFALGMCMALLSEWNAFKPGIVLGCIGLVIALIAVFVWRKMTHQPPIHVSGKMMLSILLGVIGTLGLGVGMCCTMIWDKLVLGIVIGLAGIVVLMCLIPIWKGLKD